MRGPVPTISSSASVDLTLYRSRSESLLGFHSYVEPSHNEVLACCSWLMLLYIEAVDRYANRRGFSSLFLQCRDKKSSLTGIKQPPDDQDQQALLNLSLSYPKGLSYNCWNLHKQTRPCKASIVESLFLLLGNHGRNTPQHTPKRRRTDQPCMNFQTAVVQAGKCPGLNNTNCVLSYTSIGGASLKPLQLLLQLSHLLLLRLVDQMRCNRLEHQSHRVNPRIRLVPAVHG